jgi:hypothetical protein
VDAAAGGGPMSKRTPGPWTVRIESWSDVVVEGIYGPNGEAVAERSDEGGYISKEDAHLISAAPDLLTSLKAYVKEERDSWDYISSDQLDAAEAAIAKAESR